MVWTKTAPPKPASARPANSSSTGPQKAAASIPIFRHFHTALPRNSKRMPPLGKTILHLHFRSITNLFDDRQPQPIVVTRIGSLIKPPEDPAPVKRLCRARIAHPQTMFLEPGMDLTLAHIVADGIAEEIIE